MNISIENRVLVTDDVHPDLLNGLRDLGFEPDYHSDITLEETRNIVHDYSGIVINSKIKVDKLFMDQAPQLRFVARLGSGLDIIDLPEANKRNIHVLNSPEGNSNAVGEQALGMLLALSNHIVEADREVRNGIWNREKNRGFELSGKTIGIYGFGHTGSQFAKKLSGFDVKVLAYDKFKKGYAQNFIHVQESGPEALFSSDIISFHLPLNSETFHLCDKRFLEQCKPGVVIINTSRGNVVKTSDLLLFLENGKVAGACLDVFENEKVKTFTPEESMMYNRLYALSNVVLTPHIAGWTKESKQKIAHVLLDKIKKIV